jgi:hypothetical protein
MVPRDWSGRITLHSLMPRYVLRTINQSCLRRLITEIQADECTTEVLPERGVGYAQSVCSIVNNMGRQVTLSSMVGMRFQNVIEEPLRN